MNRILCLMSLFALMAWAEERKKVSAEGEFEASHDGSYAYTGLSAELEKPKLSVSAAGYRLTGEDGKTLHQVHLGISRPFEFWGKRVKLAPGTAAVVGQEKLRGVAATLNAEVELKWVSLSAFLSKTYTLGKDRPPDYLWLFPLLVERKVSRNWGLAGVLETERIKGEIANEYGFRIIRHDRRGQWFCGYMTAATEHGRDHRARFGRIITIGEE